MIRRSWSWNYTLSRTWDWMTITNALSNTGVESSSKAWDSWYCSPPTRSMLLTPDSIVGTPINHRKTLYRNEHSGQVVADIFKEWYWRIITCESTLKWRSDWRTPWFLWSSCPTEHTSQIMLATRQSGLYIWQLPIYHRSSARCPQHTVS